MKPALLVIDVQNYVLDGFPGYAESVAKRAGVMNEAIAVFRRKGLPIIFVYHEDINDGPRPGSKGFEFSELIDVRDTDTKLVKHYPNGFNKTSLEDILPGDHISAVLIPGTDKAVGLVAYSSVFYGRAIDYTNSNRTIYMLDDSGRYLSLYLPPDAVVYRWGVRSTANVITSDSRIRVTTDPAGEVVWQLDIADTLYTEDLLLGYNKNTGLITAAEGRQYRISETTRFFKNGYRIMADDLLPGEKIELEYAVAPPPTGNVLVSVNATSYAPQPLLLASAVPVQDRLIITGRTGAGSMVYLWEGSTRRQAPVDISGRFGFTLPREDNEGYNLYLVAINDQDGGITGRRLAADGINRGDYEAAVKDAFSGVTVQNGDAYLPGTPVSRVQAASVLARLLGWPAGSGGRVRPCPARNVRVAAAWPPRNCVP